MGRKKQRDDKVIHVVFGPGGGRVEPNGGRPSAERRDAPAQSREPLTDLFTRSEISRLLGITPTRLRTLDRAGVVSPSGRRRSKRAYTFSDLIALRTAQALLERNVRLRDVTRAITALKRTLPRVTRPLAELRIVSDGKRVVVRTQDGTFEPLTGQMVLEFEVKALRDDVVRVLRPSAGRERARTAYELLSPGQPTRRGPVDHGRSGGALPTRRGAGPVAGNRLHESGQYPLQAPRSRWRRGTLPARP